MEKYIVSIEISSSKVVLLLSTVDERGRYGLKLIHSEVRRLTKDILSRGRITNREQLKRVVQDLLMNKNVARHQGNIYYCVSVNGLDFRSISRSTSLNGENMTVSENDLESLRALMETAKTAGEDEMLVNLELRQYVIDDLLPTISPIGTACNKIEADYLLTLMKRSLMSLYSEMLGTSVNNVQIYPISSSKGLILLSPEDKQNGVALIDLGGQTTSVSVYYKDRLQGEFSLPIGSDLITKDIMKGLNESESHSESLKRAFGIEVNEETDYQQYLPTFSDGEKSEGSFMLGDLKFYARARAEELIDYVMGTINQRNDLRDRVRKIVITGGGGKLKGLGKMIEKRTNRTVEIIMDDGENGEDLTCVIGMASRYARVNAEKFAMDKEPSQWGGMKSTAIDQLPSQNSGNDGERKKVKRRNAIFDAVGSFWGNMTDESNQGEKL